MKRLAVVVLASLAACGSSDDPPPLFGGFAPTSGAAAILAPATCPVPFVGTTSVSGVFLELTSRADACDVLTAASQCGGGASSTTVLVAAVSGVVGGGGVAPAGPGAYPFLANPPTGAFKASIAEAAQLDATCAAPSGAQDMNGGGVTLTAVTASNVAGSTGLYFENGQVFKHTFDVAVCPVSIDTCSLFAPCPGFTCVP